MNGVIVTVLDGDQRSRYLYQEREDDRANLEAWADLLDHITQHHGPPDGGRHAAHRLRITIEPGDKYEPPENNGPSL